MLTIISCLLHGKNCSKGLISSFDSHEDLTREVLVISAFCWSENWVLEGLWISQDHLAISGGAGSWTHEVWPTAWPILNCILVLSHLMFTMLNASYFLGNRCYHPLFIVSAILYCCNPIQELKFWCLEPVSLEEICHLLYGLWMRNVYTSQHTEMLKNCWENERRSK